jgi:SagB-type dehydrogenase family enzyme
MGSGLTLSLKPSVRLLEDAGLEEPGVKRLGFPAAGETQRAFLRALARGASTEDELCAGRGLPAAAVMELRYLLALLEKEGWICYSLTHGGRLLATLEPLTRAFRFQPASGDGSWRLSRFAWIRRAEGAAVLETPLGFGRVLLREPELLEAVGRLCQPRTADGLASPGLPPPLARGLLSLLAAAGAVAPCGDKGQLPEDRDPALRQWEFHDLLFHSRSRGGRHGDPVGGTFRFLGDLDPLPALKPARPEGIPLPEPCLPGRDLSFFSVLDARRSVRAPGPDPITLAQLGSFLHHVARVRAVLPPDPGAGRAYEAVSGPCPGGGGLHELELYLTVSRCAGLEPGFYHYAAGAHVLEPWPSPDGASGQLLLQAQRAMGTVPAPDILFTLAARFQRVAWKYQAIAYALILKNTGVLYQQMYLVATALGLSPCAIGAGDTQLFARASGLAFTQESSVGEFALSG